MATRRPKPFGPEALGLRAVRVGCEVVGSGTQAVLVVHAGRGRESSRRKVDASVGGVQTQVRLEQYPCSPHGLSITHLFVSYPATSTVVIILSSRMGGGGGLALQASGGPLTRRHVPPSVVVGSSREEELSQLFVF